MTERRRAKDGAEDPLERGRACYERHQWEDAYTSLSRADERAPLASDDLAMLTWAAGLTGRDSEMLAALERQYRERDERSDHPGAARSAFWLGFRLMSLGEMGRATGWLAHATRHVDAAGDCVERGYLMLPVIARQLGAGDDAAAHDTAAAAAAVGSEFDDADLVALARQLQGRALLRQGDMERGLALLDEAMVTVTSGAATPLITGLVYCSVISTCQQVYALGRAREWTAALSDWCSREPQLATFASACLVHRSEILQLGGDWSEAIEEAQRACEIVSGDKRPQALADACYQRAELHRLRGEQEAAEQAYRHASQLGREPQPGLALLRLAQGRANDAVCAIRRVLATTQTAWRRPQFLPACVEIMLAAGELDEARASCRELEEIADQFRNDILDAMAAHARGAVLLGEGDARAAIAPLRQAFEVWQSVGARYIAARIRVLLGRACAELGDRDGAELERGAARHVFEQLDAAPDLTALDAPAPGGKRAARPHGLSPRELEVLRLVASGKTNKAIASELCVSERTIDRHVSNIFTKLDVSSRAAATAFAYEHALV